MSMAFNTNFNTTPATPSQYATYDPNLGRYLTYDEMVQYGLVGAGSPSGQVSRAQYESEIFRIQNPAAPPVGAPTPAGLTPEQQSAKALITSTLDSYGLKPLGEWMWQEYMNGVPLDAIWLEMRSRPEYEARFPGMKSLQSKGRSISEAQYIEYERNAIQIMRAAGIPSGVMDTRDKIGAMIGGEVSLKEFEDRLNDYQMAVFQTPQEVRDQLRSYYGVHEGEILGFFLDPDATLPLLEKRFAAAQAGGVAVASGYGTLQRLEAERLAELGLNRDQLVQGFGTLYDSSELFQDLPGGANEGTVDKQTQFGAVFEGRAQDQGVIRRRAEQRKATFGGGGGFAAGQKGITGIGSAS